jgi:hypothetical protein
VKEQQEQCRKDKKANILLQKMRKRNKHMKKGDDKEHKEESNYEPKNSKRKTKEMTAVANILLQKMMKKQPSLLCLPSVLPEHAFSR